MLFGVLLASLGRFANLLSDNLPFVVFILLDGAQKVLALWQELGQRLGRKWEPGGTREGLDTHLVLSKLSIVHILETVSMVMRGERRRPLADLIPMFLYTALGTAGKGLKGVSSSIR